jgi:hypothetical protein
LAGVAFAVGDERGRDALAAMDGVGDEEFDEAVAEETVVSKARRVGRSAGTAVRVERVVAGGIGVRGRRWQDDGV